METHLVFFEGLLVKVEKGVCTKSTAESEMKPLFGGFSFSFSFFFCSCRFFISSFVFTYINFIDILLVFFFAEFSFVLFMFNCDGPFSL